MARRRVVGFYRDSQKRIRPITARTNPIPNPKIVKPKSSVKIMKERSQKINEEKIEELREELANYFLGNGAYANDFKDLVFQNKKGEIIIDARVLNGWVDDFPNAYSRKDIWKIIKDVTGIPWKDWHYSIDFQGGFYYAKT